MQKVENKEREVFTSRRDRFYILYVSLSFEQAQDEIPPLGCPYGEGAEERFPVFVEAVAERPLASVALAVICPCGNPDVSAPALYAFLFQYAVELGTRHAEFRGNLGYTVNALVLPLPAAAVHVIV